MLFIDLLKHYEVILPGTIASKKRESDRRVPIKKRTALIDMRLSRSRISTDADPKQLLVAQQLAQNPTLAKKATSPERLALSHQPVAKNETPAHPHPPSTQRTELADVPAPPPVPVPPPAAVADSPPRPTFKEPPPEDGDLPPRPAFKEPPPEIDDSPTRPTFKEPPPEVDDVPPRPSFVDPPPEVDELASPKSAQDTNSRRSPPPASPPPQRNVKRQSSVYSRSDTSSPSKGSRSSSPNPESLKAATSSLSRTAQLRGPRAVTKGPRAPPGNNANRSGSPPPATSPTAAQRRVSTSPRPSSIFGRLARRSMASDAEDNVVERK